jgi:hypothetical protein
MSMASHIRRATLFLYVVLEEMCSHISRSGKITLLLDPILFRKSGGGVGINISPDINGQLRIQSLLYKKNRYFEHKTLTISDYL